MILMENNMDIIRFPKGTYHFWPDFAYEGFYYISNNDSGNKKISFPVINRKNLIIDGGGSEFIFHGRVTPFVIDGAENIKVCNLNIDYERPFFSQGVVIDSSQKHIDIRIDPIEFPYEIKDRMLIFKGENWRSEPEVIMYLTEFDPKTKAPAYKMAFNLAKWSTNPFVFNDEFMDSLLTEIVAEALPSGDIRLRGNFNRVFEKGNYIEISHESRYNPGFFINNSCNITLENINIYHASAMGVIAQMSRDVVLKSVNVKLREGTSRLVSSNADATHFVHCHGTLTLEDCEFTNMLDDGVNIHGIYSIITDIPTPDTIIVELKHYQQHGLNLYLPGDVINIINRKTLSPMERLTVKESKLIGPSHVKIVLEEICVASVGDAVDNYTRMPNVVIRNCRTGNNRPRGFLVTTPGHVLIENNEFFNSHCAISILGDANFWYESGAVGNVTIRGNIFRNCEYASGMNVIYINPEIMDASESIPCYHANIAIENNRFETFDKGLLFARSVDGLRFTRNTYKQTDTYAPMGNVTTPVTTISCKNVYIEDCLAME